MWLPNDTPEYWSARERELIAKHDAQRMARNAHTAETESTRNRVTTPSAVLAQCRSAVGRCSATVRAVANAAGDAVRLGPQRPAPRRG
jgi:hypothetical protein